MALMNCPECSKEISDKAPSCPNCGAPSSLQRPAGAVTFKKQGMSHSKTIGLGVLIGLVVLLGWMWRSALSDTAAPPSAGLLAALRQPKKLVNERTQLNEGRSIIYSFYLPTDSRVQVEANATPKAIDVMLMNSDQAAKFREANGKLFGGNYTYTQALSGQQVLTMDKTAVLPSGNWSIVVLRPRESIIFTEETAASIRVTAY
jgi:hypothetical protein